MPVICFTVSAYYGQGLVTRMELIRSGPQGDHRWWINKTVSASAVKTRARCTAWGEGANREGFLEKVALEKEEHLN